MRVVPCDECTARSAIAFKREGVSIDAYPAPLFRGSCNVQDPEIAKGLSARPASENVQATAEEDTGMCPAGWWKKIITCELCPGKGYWPKEGEISACEFTPGVAKPQWDDILVSR